MLDKLRYINESIKNKSPLELLSSILKISRFYFIRLRNLVRENMEMNAAYFQDGAPDFLRSKTQPGYKDSSSVIKAWGNRLKTALLDIDSDVFTDRYSRIFPEQKDQLIDFADEIVKGVITLFFSKKTDVNAGINWHSTIDGDGEWPRIYFRNIDLKTSSKTGDIRTTWELNRHVHWVVLGRAYLVTGRVEYFQCFHEQFQDWAKNNPYHIGVNWLSSMEVGIRLNHWLAAYACFCDCPEFDERLKIRFFSWVYLHTHYLHHHLSIDDRNCINNHVIMESASLYIAAALLPEFKDAKLWRNKSRSLLSFLAERLFFSDGFHEETCSSYHFQVTQAYLFSFLISVNQNLPVPSVWRNRLKQMIEVLALIARANGNLPLIGDGDDGIFLLLDSDNSRMNVSSLLSMANTLSLTEFRCADDSPKEGVFWYSRSNSRSPIPEHSHSEELKALYPSQVAVVRNRDSSTPFHLLFSAGVRAPDHNYGHRHADLLNTLLSLRGNDILIDPGTYTYNGPLEWRRYFQSTKRHNTVTFNDCDQVQFSGNFGISKIAYSSTLSYSEGDEHFYIEGKYHNKLTGCFHRRTLICKMPLYLVFVDDCFNSTGGISCLNFTLGERICPRKVSKEKIPFIESEHFILYCFSYGDLETSPCDIVHTHYSSSYGVLRKGHSIQARNTGKRVRFISIFLFSRESKFESHDSSVDLNIFDSFSMNTENRHFNILIPSFANR